MNKSTDFLDGAIGYLAGAITYAQDDGVDWRSEIKDKAGKMIPKLRFFDPTDKPAGLGSEIGFEKQQVHQWKQEGKFDLVVKGVKKYRRLDLRMVDNSNFIIVMIDLDQYTVGSHDEMFVAERQQKPILIVVKQGKNNAPDWLFAVTPHEQIFNNLDECMDYLRKLNDGDIKLDDRWVLYNGEFL